jgi:hypothetical protein
MDCMAATPLSGRSRASAFITKFEKAKEKPGHQPAAKQGANVKYISFAATAPMIPPGLRSRERVKDVEISRRWYT